MCLKSKCQKIERLTMNTLITICPFVASVRYTKEDKTETTADVDMAAVIVNNEKRFVNMKGCEIPENQFTLKGFRSQELKAYWYKYHDLILY